MNRPFVIIGIVVIALVVAAFWTFPTYQEYASLSVELLEKRTELQNREDYMANLRELELRLESFTEELGKLHVAVPNNSSLPSLYDLVQRLSSESGLVLRQISAVEDAKKTTQVQTKTVEVNLNLEGSYEGLKAFLLRVQTAPRLLDVTSVGFTSPPPGLSTQFNFVVHINAFSY